MALAITCTRTNYSASAYMPLERMSKRRYAPRSTAQMLHGYWCHPFPNGIHTVYNPVETRTVSSVSKMPSTSGLTSTKEPLPPSFTISCFTTWVSYLHQALLLVNRPSHTRISIK